MTRVKLEKPVTHRTSDAEVTAGITPADYTKTERDVLRYENIVDDASTDNTSALLAVMNAMPGFYYIPKNVVYDRLTLLQSLDTDVVIRDDSQVNSYTSAGETTKRVGIIASDEPTSDSAWNIDSGYHAVLVTNNFGTEGTSGGSAEKGLASWFWARGHHTEGAALGNIQKRGDRYMAKAQFGNFDPSTNDFWQYVISCILPWLAQGADYWVPSEAGIVSGTDYRISSVGVYVAASSGTTGSTEPTHESGTTSDGGVDWTFVDYWDRGLYSLDQYGRIRVGDPTSGFTFGIRTGYTDPGGGQFSAVFEARGTSQSAQMRLVPTNSSGNLASQPYLQAQDGGGLRVFDSTGNFDLARFQDSGMLLNVAHFVAETATNLGNASNAINTTNKYAGRIVRDSTNNRLLMASGTGATDTWDNIADGSTEITPS